MFFSSRKLSVFITLKLPASFHGFYSVTPKQKQLHRNLNPHILPAPSYFNRRFRCASPCETQSRGTGSGNRGIALVKAAFVSVTHTHNASLVWQMPHFRANKVRWGKLIRRASVCLRVFSLLRCCHVVQISTGVITTNTLLWVACYTAVLKHAINLIIYLLMWNM